jgi:hypothetical protein
MQFKSLNMLSDFIQVLDSIRKHYTKNEYFCKHVLFTTIYLLSEQKLNYITYREHEINMSNFVHAAEHELHMYAKFGGLTCY